MDLFTKWHVKDGEGYDQLSARATKLNPMTDFSGMKDDDGDSIQCPFSSMAKLEKVEKYGDFKEGYVHELAPITMSVPGGGIGSIESIAQGPLYPHTPRSTSSSLSPTL